MGEDRRPSPPAAPSSLALDGETSTIVQPPTQPDVHMDLPPRRGLGLRAKGLGVLAISLVSFTVVIVGYNFALANQREARSLVGRTSEVRRQIRLVLSQILEAETGSRGFAFSRREAFPEPVAAAAAQLPADVHRLEQLVAGTAMAPGRSLQQLVETRMAVLRELVGTARLPGVTPSQLNPLVDRGKANMDALRAELIMVYERTQRLRTERTPDAAAPGGRGNPPGHAMASLLPVKLNKDVAPVGGAV